MSAVEKPVVIVTGASKGIGLAVAQILLQNFNACVISLSRTLSPELRELAQSSKPNLNAIECDITNEQAVRDAVADAVKNFNRIDALVLNAGMLEPLARIASDTPLGLWRQHFEVNFFSLITIIRASMPYLRSSSFGGKIIFVSSGAAIGGIAGWAPYNASKAAMNSLCRTLAEEEPDVTCVALRPGKVDTKMQELLRSQGSNSMERSVHESFVRDHTDGKLLRPELPGHVIASLAVSAARSLSGQFLSWDSDECRPYRK